MERTDAATRGERGRRAALAALSAAALMVILDTTIVSVALPSIRADLALSDADMAWVVNAYLVSFGGLLLLAGRLGDLLGRARVFRAGLVLFLVASLLGGLAQDAPQLVAARFLQGAGGALASAVVLGMIVTLFPEPRERARAIGVYAAVGAAGASLGTVLGGVLTDALGWHWIFFVNVPIGAATLAAAAWALPRERGLGLARGSDALGGALAVAALMLGVFTIVEAGERGWLSARTLGGAAAALALLAALALRERSIADPLLPPRVFRLPGVAAANAVQALMVAGMFAQQFVIALFLQRVRGLEPVEVGLAMLPVAATIGVVSLTVAAWVMGRIGLRATLVAGLVPISAGLALLARVPADAAYAVDLLPALLAMGLGAGLALPAITTLAMAGATDADAGVVSGLASTTQQVGAAVGLAILTSVASARSEALGDGGAAAADALAGGYRAAFAVAAGLTVAALLAALVALRERPAGAAAPATAARDAA